MNRTKQKTLEARIRQRNELGRFLREHKGEYYVQINFGVPGSADHICVPIPYDKAHVVTNEVQTFLIEETCK